MSMAVHQKKKKVKCAQGFQARLCGRLGFVGVANWERLREAVLSPFFHLNIIVAAFGFVDIINNSKLSAELRIAALHVRPRKHVEIGLLGSILGTLLLRGQWGT